MLYLVESQTSLPIDSIDAEYKAAQMMGPIEERPKPTGRLLRTGWISRTFPKAENVFPALSTVKVSYQWTIGERRNFICQRPSPSEVGK